MHRGASSEPTYMGLPYESWTLGGDLVGENAAVIQLGQYAAQLITYIKPGGRSTPLGADRWS